MRGGFSGLNRSRLRMGSFCPASAAVRIQHAVAVRGLAFWTVTGSMTATTRRFSGSVGVFGSARCSR